MVLKMKSILKLVVLVGFFLMSLGNSLSVQAMTFADAEPQECVREGANTGTMKEFKDNYIPVEYFPTPEYMIFVDLGVLILLLLVGLFLVLKRKNQRSLIWMAIITFAYLGFIRGGCVCPVGAISNTTMGLISPDQVGLASFIIFMVPLIIALVAGRIFCSSGCPLGAIQAIGQKSKKTLKLPKKVNIALKIVPIAMLIGTIYYAVKSSCFLVCEVEPYKVLFFNGQIWFEQLLAYIKGQPMEAKFLIGFGIGSWLYLIGILVLGYWVPRPFCRFLCPYGVLLGLVSMFSLKPRRIKESCVYCGMCEKACPTQAITIDRKQKIAVISNYDCVQCNKCNDTCRKDAI